MKENLTDILIRSERTNSLRRKTLCQDIGVDIGKISNAYNLADNDFAKELICSLFKKDLKRTIYKLCKVIKPDFPNGKYAKLLEGIIAELEGELRQEDKVLPEYNLGRNSLLRNPLPQTNPELNFDYVYLLIELIENASERFKVNTLLAIPESFERYSYIKLRKNFQEGKSYSQLEIEEKIVDLILECNEQVADFNPETNFRIAIEWMLPDNLLSLPVDCWRYKNRRIGCGRFFSVHIRSSRRFNKLYRDCIPLWQKKWKFICHNHERIDLCRYILASQCQTNNYEALAQLCYDEQNMILGINFASKAQVDDENYRELIIENGILFAMWSRCKNDSLSARVQDLDRLIRKENLSGVEIKRLLQSIKAMRLSARDNDELHLGKNLCFLWENPYNYPIKNNYSKFKWN